MAGKIPASFIQDLLARVDLVDLIDARVPLKRSGGNFVARCPFHTEKTPSFNVSREKQFYHCFGCGAHGNAIGFLMEYDRLGFVEAVEQLAESVGITIPRDRPRGPEDRQAELMARLYEIQERVSRFYHHQLKAHAEAARAVDYLKRRGVSGEIARRFRLGYAPPGWQNLPAEFPRPLLEAAGLAASKDGRSYDRFRDRITFPIRDRRGRVVGFGGRVMDDGTPKYLNSPETAVFRKHKEVYGLYELLKSGAKPRRIVVVEGYMDVIALAQHGISNAVATLGTATSSDHIDLLFRHANELVFCFDGDTAGQNAAWKALEASLPALREGRSLSFLALPEGHDPDSLVRQEGAEGFMARIEHAKPFSRYLVEQLTHRLGFATIATPEQRAALRENARPLTERLPSGSFKEEVERSLANLIGADLVERRRSTILVGASSPTDRQRRRTPSLFRTFLALLLQNPELAASISAETRQRLERKANGGELVRRILRLLDEQPNLTAGRVLESFRDLPDEKWIRKLLVERTDLISTEDTRKCLEAVEKIDASVRETFQTVLDRLDKQMKSERLEALILKSRTANLSPEEQDEMRTLMI